MSLPAHASRPASPVVRAVTGMGVLLAAMWALEGVDTLTGHALDTWGISPRDVDELPQVYSAWALHFGWPHLIGNSVPLFVLGFLILLESQRRWLVSGLASITGSGLFAWLFSPPNSVTAGASGLVFGWLTYLLARGIFSRDWRQILLAVVVGAVYGSVLWGVLPLHEGVSWQGHLGGAIGGLGAAWYLHSPRRVRRRSTQSR